MNLAKQDLQTRPTCDIHNSRSKKKDIQQKQGHNSIQKQNQTKQNPKQIHTKFNNESRKQN